MSEHFNKLTPAETERLDILAEECAEVIQAVSKIKRHGYESCHPNGGPTNRRMLEKELGDVRLAEYLVIEAGDVQPDKIKQSEDDKYHSIKKYLHHNKFLFEAAHLEEV